MKILHIGNPEAFKNFAICNFFLEKGHEIHYFSPKSIKTRHSGIIYHNNPNIGRSKIGILKNILFLRKTIKMINPDIIHAHNVGTYGWMAGLSGFSPLIIHAYGSDVLPSQTAKLRPYQFWLSRNAVKKADRLVVTGKHMVSAVANNFKISPKKIKAIPRGVNLFIFRPFKKEVITELKKKYGIPQESFVLLSPRYLFDSVYNIDVIIKAVGHVIQKIDNIVLIQMHNHTSDSAAYIKMNKLITQLNLQNKIYLKRNVPNDQMAEIMNIADICISVPSSDGFPVTVLESSACGIPMVVSRLPYTSEWFKDGLNGLVVEQGDVVQLGEAIETLLTNEKLRQNIIQNNLIKVNKEANYLQCMKQLESLYLELL